MFVEEINRHFRKVESYYSLDNVIYLVFLQTTQFVRHLILTILLDIEKILAILTCVVQYPHQLQDVMKSCRTQTIVSIL